MPKAAPKPCSHPGCRALVHKRYCDAHQKAFRKRQDERRGSSAERGYDTTWRRLRLSFLAQHPLCECEDCDAGRKRLTPANVVDHIVSIEERPELRLEWSNLRAMAKACHDRRTARDQAFGKSAPVGGSQKSMTSRYRPAPNRFFCNATIGK